MWFSCNFKAALDYSSLYRSIYFCHDTTLKKKILIEKMNLAWNKQTNCNKLYPLPSTPPKKLWKILPPPPPPIC